MVSPLRGRTDAPLPSREARVTEPLFKFIWQEAVCGRGPGARDDLTPTERLVGLAASTWMDANGAGVRPGITRLCNAAGLKKRATVTRALAGLERKGYLTCVHRGGRGLLGASVYVGCLPHSLGTVGSQAPSDRRSLDHPPPGDPQSLGLGTAAGQAGYPGGTPSVQDQSSNARARECDCDHDAKIHGHAVGCPVLGEVQP